MLSRLTCVTVSHYFCHKCHDPRHDVTQCCHERCPGHTESLGPGPGSACLQLWPVPGSLYWPRLAASHQPQSRPAQPLASPGQLQPLITNLTIVF